MDYKVVVIVFDLVMNCLFIFEIEVLVFEVIDLVVDVVDSVDGFGFCVLGGFVVLSNEVCVNIVMIVCDCGFCVLMVCILVNEFYFVLW